MAYKRPKSIFATRRGLGSLALKHPPRRKRGLLTPPRLRSGGSLDYSL